MPQAPCGITINAVVFHQDQAEARAPPPRPARGGIGLQAAADNFGLVSAGEQRRWPYQRRASVHRS